ncbi:IMSP1-like protein [Mya arenaria]|uniref:IMSP1-like protein n=1 Tax=Mya arenaria TaxID=6604 RepID=A0ABY7F9N3_MYAAR|nr:IMSP1-like protein [Mya arenaria]
MWRNALLVVNLCVFGFVAGKSFPEVNGGWHIHVTLHVFSGRADPTWTIPYSHVDYKEIIQLMDTKPDSRLFSRLGYKGFTLVHVPPGHFVTSGSHYNATVTSYPELEMKILMTSLEKKEESGVDEYIIDHTKQAILEDHNNCYNYANNKITDTFAQPGRAGSCEIGTHPTGNDFKRAALCDGLKEILTPRDVPVPDSGWNLVALVFWPPKPGSMLFDFHWYRLDGNSRWSHKPGRTVATNVDDSKKAIRDPRTADRGPYTEFVAFLETRQDKVLLI